MSIEVVRRKEPGRRGAVTSTGSLGPVSSGANLTGSLLPHGTRRAHPPWHTWNVDDLTCAACGTDDHLRGVPEGEQIRIHCDGCGASWIRDSTPRCEKCGGEDMALEKRPVIEKARGSQLSIVGYTDVALCKKCDVDEINREWRHIRPGENPAG